MRLGREAAHRMMLRPAARRQLPVRMNEAKQNVNSPAGDRDHEQVPEGSARVGKIWRMLMLEKCRLLLLDNSFR